MRNFKSFKKLVSIVLLVMFTMNSGTLTVTPAVASPSGGLVRII